MAAERIAELRALAAVAAPGPWKTCRTARNTPDAVCIIENYGLSIGATEPGSAWGIFHYKDADFIAAARTALPEALDAIERVRAAALEMRAFAQEKFENDDIELACHAMALTNATTILDVLDEYQK